MWKRLNVLGEQFAPDNYYITVIQRPGESLEQTEAKLERWRQGKEDSDITARPCTGREQVVILRSFLD